jgi:hypothetical protein
MLLHAPTPSMPRYLHAYKSPYTPTHLYASHTSMSTYYTSTCTRTCSYTFQTSMRHQIHAHTCCWRAYAPGVSDACRRRRVRRVWRWARGGHTTGMKAHFQTLLHAWRHQIHVHKCCRRAYAEGVGDGVYDKCGRRAGGGQATDMKAHLQTLLHTWRHRIHAHTCCRRAYAPGDRRQVLAMGVYDGRGRRPGGIIAGRRVCQRVGM